MFGRVEKYLLDKIKTEGAIHFTLIDPEKVTPQQASSIAENSCSSGTSAIMIGGSTFVSPTHLDDVVLAIKDAIKLPTILFPNNVTGISHHADAIWFMSLLNSTDPYFVIGAQVLGAPLIKKYQLEAISMGYIIVGDGGTAGIIGKAVAVPYDKSELAVAHALAGQYLGMHFIYLEGGSGAKKPVPPEMIHAVTRNVDVPVVVGGGIRNKDGAIAAVGAGAAAIVTGNITESSDSRQRIAEIVEGIRRPKS